MTFSRYVYAALNFLVRMFGGRTEPATPGVGDIRVGYVLDAEDVAAIEALVTMARPQPEEDA